MLLEEQRRAMNAEHSISADLRIVDTGIDAKSQAFYQSTVALAEVVPVV